MRAFLILNLLVAFAWMSWRGQFSLEEAIIGLFVGGLVVIALGTAVGKRTFAHTGSAVVELLGILWWEQLVTSVQVAKTVLSPRLPLKPGVLAVPLNVHTDVEVALVANLITLTPGTVSIDISADKKALYVHVFWVEDPENVINTARRFETAVIRVFSHA